MGEGSNHVPADSLALLKVGELAKRTGKTVRAVHLYEELGLLAPAVRSKGNFRLYSGKAVKRIDWIQKLQDLGFSLTEIKAFLRDWEESAAAPKAMARVREIFSDKLRETQETIARLERLVGDLTETLAYMDSCRSCEPTHTQAECGTCGIHGHDGRAPLLVEGIAK
ncbi:MAG TPA: MerR family transcriptional regulator [Polyangia bacterium]|nr:MerR family transcriptional regulator [Polyangia bacterium]